MSYSSSYNSSYSSGAYSSYGYAQTSGDGTSSSSSNLEIGVSASTPDDSEGVYAAAGVDALAAGEDTLAAANVTGQIVDGGSATFTDLSATGVAVAETPDDSAFATVDTFAAISEGSELLITYNQQNTTTTQNSSGSTVAVSETSAINAMDLDLDDTSGASSTANETPDPAPAETGDGDTSSTNEPVWDLGGDDGLDGNVAVAEFNILAVGEDTFAGVDAFAIAVEDQLSVSTISAELAAG